MSRIDLSESRQQWYVVQSKPRQESIALDNLRRQGYSAYCPRVMLLRHRRQRWKTTNEPLFPRYLFVALRDGVDNFSPIRSTLGVSDLVRFGSKPAFLPGHVIETIRQQEQKLRERMDSHPAWQAGDLVEIIDGPFAGLKAVFENARGTDRVMVLFELLGCQNRVAIDVNHIATAT